jgi:hypothetical protein
VAAKQPDLGDATAALVPSDVGDEVGHLCSFVLECVSVLRKIARAIFQRGLMGLQNRTCDFWPCGSWDTVQAHQSAVGLASLACVSLDHNPALLYLDAGVRPGREAGIVEPSSLEQKGGLGRDVALADAVAVFGLKQL